MAAIDLAAGVLLAELERLGLTDNTVVIFTSDNGSRARDEGGSNDPLRGGKGTTWEGGGMRVPGIIRWPGHVPAGVVNDELTSSLDLLPTLAAFTGANLSEDRVLDGLDVGGVLTGTAPTPRRTRPLPSAETKGGGARNSGPRSGGERSRALRT